ncbi:MAG: hypothetical protein ACJAXQ_000246 [Parvibaculaceae bacterium]|jgi:hypothetical protein
MEAFNSTAYGLKRPFVAISDAAARLFQGEN